MSFRVAKLNIRMEQTSSYGFCCGEQVLLSSFALRTASATSVLGPEVRAQTLQAILVDRGCHS